MAESQPSYMIVDGVLGEYVQEISGYIDALNKVAEGSDGLVKKTSELMAQETSESQEQTFQIIAEQSSVLGAAPEREFEAAYNLVLHILTFSSRLTEILPVVLKNLSENGPQTANGPVLVLAVMSNLFNILPASSPLRFTVFQAILKFAAATNNLHLILGQLKNLPVWLNQWGVDEANKQSLYAEIGDLVEKIDAEASYKHLLDAVSSSAGASAQLSEKLIAAALNSLYVYDFDEILALPGVQSVKTSNPELFKLLEVVSNGDYKGYTAIDVKATGVNAETVEKKVKVLNLASLASSAPARTVSYDAIASALNIDKEEVEMWVIDAIRAGLVEGRLCQMEQQFDIHRASPVGKFGIEEWKLVQNRLDQWRTSLKEIAEVLRNSRENAQKEVTKLKAQKPQAVN
ncbi:hypothetical protein TRVA0_001S04214 [Trichomonascus vanleenenianus]|uniref:PCI domain-containing protein n=1 Tax=Trichomonascus vanleenenianus TaxID=2268995 RepID=UPI003EC9641E